jgi:predicted enzyme related to lactoylglutathione lyase
MKDTSAINYFEIPVTDMGRAKKFYETIFGFEMTSMKLGTGEFASFPQQKIGGSLAKDIGREPSKAGILCYLNAGKDLTIVLNKIEKAGGNVVTPKIQIMDHGFIAKFIDTEGNLVALHSMN